jgi:hypothetical protein
MQYEFSPYIRENVEFLTKLTKTKSERKKRALLLTASSDQILAIVEICANILKTNFVLTTRQRRRLSKYADYYRSIARTKSERTARHRIQQVGQGAAIGALLIPVLSAIAGHLLEKVLPESSSSS